ncbi:MAG: hypothetical protein IJW46_04665 [Clostridia bacterium]|nr:hypothetical protein [Clostridia bacterium]
MKRKIFLIALVVCLLAVTVTNATVAYFTDTKKSTDTYTAGNVYIELSEAAVVADATGNLVEDTTADRIYGSESGTLNNVGKIYPAQTIHKDPTIVNTGNEDAWIAAKVILSDGVGDLHKVIGYPGFEAVDIELLLQGGLLDERIHVGEWNGFSNVCHNARYAMVQIPNHTTGEYVFYFFILAKMSPGESVELFDTLSIPTEWNNTELKELVDFDIHV